MPCVILKLVGTPANSTMLRALNVVYEGCKTTNTMNESKAKKTCPLEEEVGPLKCVMPPRKRVFVHHHCVTIRFHAGAPLATKWKLEVLCGLCTQSKLSHPWSLSGFSFPATRLLAFSFFGSFVRFHKLSITCGQENAKRLFIHALFLWDLMHVYTCHL